MNKEKKNRFSLFRKKNPGNMTDIPDPVSLSSVHEKERRYCNLCPRLCRHSCPVSNAERDEALIPGNKNAVAGLVASGKREMDGEVADLFFKCANCGLCQSFCEHENDISESLLSARAMAVQAGLEPPGFSELNSSFEKYGNAWQEDLVPRILDLVPSYRRAGEAGTIAGDRNISTIKGRGLRIYWAGCAAIARMPDLVSQALGVFDRLGEPDISVYCGNKAQCCGFPLLAAGRHEAFAAQARKAYEALSGADMIVTSSPECAWTFSVAWPQRAGVPPPAGQIIHTVDLLLPAIRHAPLMPPLKLDAVYHDPCYLGRFLKRYDEPRRLLNTLLDKPLKEAESWKREEGYCCGAGGEFDRSNPDTSDSITMARIGHLLGLSSGPPGETDRQSIFAMNQEKSKHIITACPRCITKFREAGVSALDIIEAVHHYLSGTTP